jgi:transcriptional regulator with GAF, ATPase, and Fis domain
VARDPRPSTHSAAVGRPIDVPEVAGARSRAGGDAVRRALHHVREAAGLADGAIAVDRIVDILVHEGLTVRDADHRRLAEEHACLRAASIERAVFADVVGDSAAMCQVRAAIARAAAGDEGVLVVGEPGTGRSLVARSIHAHSPRRAGSLLHVTGGAPLPAHVEVRLFGPAGGARPARSTIRTDDEPASLLLEDVMELSRAAQARLLGARCRGRPRATQVVQTSASW